MEFSISRHSNGSMATCNFHDKEALTVAASCIISYPGSALITPLTYSQEKLLGTQLPGFATFAPGRNILLETVLFPSGSLQNKIRISPHFPGEIVEFELDDNSLFIQASNFLACTNGITLTPQFHDFFDSQEFFPTLRASGKGLVLVAAYGSLSPSEIAESAVMSIHSLVCWDDQINIQGYFPPKKIFPIASVGQSAVIISGKGNFWTQSANLEKLILMHRQELIYEK